MKRLLAILMVAANGCVHQPARSVITPDAGGVKAGIDQAQLLLSEARASTGQIGSQVEKARTKAEQIDRKATVILENWR